MTTPSRDPCALALNCGSSSLKFGLFRMIGDRLDSLASGEAAGLGAEGAGRFSAAVEGDGTFVDEAPVAGHEEALGRVLEFLTRRGAPRPAVIGHRIVGGGPGLRGHRLVDAAVLRALEEARALAPLHAPQALRVLRAARTRSPGLPEVACLDTAFHDDMPAVARRFPLPGLAEAGIERCGFHGLSCASIVRRLGADLPERLVIAHLGGGSSVTAVKDGRSVDTSMGLTPTGGVVMASRSGDLDPGLIVWLMRRRGLDADALEDLINRRAGLKGASGVSGDLRTLRASTSPEAALAIAMYVRSVSKAIAAMGAVLGGLDLVVFTGGVGEHDTRTRKEIVAALAWLGAPTRVMPAREEEEIARIALETAGI